MPATYAQELARRGRPQAIPNPNSSNHIPAAPAASDRVAASLGLPPIAAPAMGAAAPVAYGSVQGISPCALGLCDEATITAPGGPTIGPGVFAAPQVMGTPSPEADAWYRRAAERTFGGRSISVPAAGSEVAAGRVLGLMGNPAFGARMNELAPLVGTPAAAAQARQDVAQALGLMDQYAASPAFGADQRLLDTAQAQAQARAAAAGVYDTLGVWNDIRPNAQALVPVQTPQGAGVSVPNAAGGWDVIPTPTLAQAAVATPTSVQRDVLAQRAQANQQAAIVARQQAALQQARLRLAAARQAQAARLAGESAVQSQRDAAAAQRQEDRLKSKATPSAASATPTL